MPTVNDPNGTPVRVRDNGYILNYAASMSMEAHAGDHGDTYSVVYSGDPGGTDADFLYFKNTSDKTLRIYKIKVYCTADVEIAVKVGVTGTPTNTTTVIPVNALVGSGNDAEGDFYSRAGDLALTGGSIFDSLIYDNTSNNEVVWDYSGEIALLKNQTIVWNAVTDPSASIRLTVYFYYHDFIE